MKQSIKQIFTPNHSIDEKLKLTVFISWVVILFSYWSFSGSQYVPTPGQVFDAMHQLVFEQHFMNDLLISTILCFKALLYASLISLSIAYLSVIPFFRPFSALIAKFRFLTTIGLTFLFAEMTSDTNHQKVVILVFGITVFLVTGACATIINVKKDELDYARTLKMNEWQVTWEVIIVGKLDQMFEIIRQNFAMAWMLLVMVENLCRSEGGIGVVLFDTNKHFKLDSVYAIQIMVLITGMLLDLFLGFLKTKFFPYSVIELQRT